jgi:hypothetical protein
MVGDAARRVARADPARPWFLYVDAIYRAIAGLTGARLDECLHDGARLRLAIETPSETARAAKRDAVAEYRSQQRVLGGRIVDAFAGEQFLAVGDR